MLLFIARNTKTSVGAKSIVSHDDFDHDDWSHTVSFSSACPAQAGKNEEIMIVGENEEMNN